MSKYGVTRKGASVGACFFVVADGCCGSAVHSYCNGGKLPLILKLNYITFLRNKLHVHVVPVGC